MVTVKATSLPMRSCASTNQLCAPTAQPGPAIAEMSNVVARGPEAFFHLRTDLAPDAIDVTVAGQVSTPMYVDEPALGGVYPLPAATNACAVSVSVANKGAKAPSDCRVLLVPHGQFEEISADAGVAVLHNTQDDLGEEFPASTGLAFGDIDNDGDPDLYLANFGIPGILFRNDGVSSDGRIRFTDITQAAGIDGVFRGSSVAFFDLDGDTDLDLFVGRDGPDKVFANQWVETGRSTFVDISVASGLVRADANLTNSHRTTSIALGDYDQDGRLDAYVASHITNINDAETMHQDRLFWNNGAGFTEVTELLGNIGDQTRLATFAAAWVDVDRDGDPDLLVASDHDSFSHPKLARPNVLWLNDGPVGQGVDGRQWRFSDHSEASGFARIPDGKGQGLNAMGLAIADIDGDGTPDAAMSNIGPNALLMNRSRPGAPRFEDVASAAGVERTYLPWQPKTVAGSRRAAWQDMSITWGTQFLDVDNDRDLDLFFVGGAPVDNFHGAVFGRRPIPNALFFNDGNGRFSELAFAAGLADPGPGMGSAVVDLDGDGWLDIAVAPYRGRFRLYRNRGREIWPEHGSLTVRLHGKHPNTQAVGAEVTVTTADEQRQRCFHISQPGLAGGSELACHFGLRDASPASVEIRWPTGDMQTYPVSADAVALRCTE